MCVCGAWRRQGCVCSCRCDELCCRQRDERRLCVGIVVPPTACLQHVILHAAAHAGNGPSAAAVGCQRMEAHHKPRHTLFQILPAFFSLMASLWLARPRPTCTAPPTTPATGSTTAPAMPAGGAAQKGRRHMQVSSWLVLEGVGGWRWRKWPESHCPQFAVPCHQCNTAHPTAAACAGHAGSIPTCCPSPLHAHAALRPVPLFTCLLPSPWQSQMLPPAWPQLWELQTGQQHRMPLLLLLWQCPISGQQRCPLALFS